MVYGCIGEKLSHSFSKEIHAEIGGYEYELCEVPGNDFARFMSERNFRGINVTIPYKRDVIPYLDVLDKKAEKIGAVNTVVNRGGRLYGYNTDFDGMRAMLERAKIELSGKKVLILGTGGTGRTAAALSEELGAKEVLKVSRSGRDGALTYGECLEKQTDADVIINTTPCGMYPDTDNLPIDISAFKMLSGVADVIYNPLRTRLSEAAQERGIPNTGGLFMLAAQGVYASEHFTGRKYGADVIEKVYRSLLKEKENIVLTGMPASGKTTIGRRIAKDLGREFTDTDEEIVKKAGMTIPEIFARLGERAFRDLETQACREAGKKSGCVIATGGGVPLSDENIRLLKQHGRIYFIDRPPERLVPTEDRPLASTAEDIKKIFEKRYTIYIKTADETVSIGDDAAENAKIIERRHGYESGV